MTKALIVDKHPIFRSGLVSELAGMRDVAVIGEASDTDEAISKFCEHHPDLVLLGVSSNGRDDPEVMKFLNDPRARGEVLILSDCTDGHYAAKYLKAGAKGYLTKDAAPEEIRVAIRKVISGGKYISSSLADFCLTRRDFDVERLPHEDLTGREIEVLVLLGQGLTVSEIANQLSLSLSTICTHRVHILKKMGMQTTAQLMRYAIVNGLTVGD